MDSKQNEKMIEFIKHALGICGEPHPSLLTLLASTPIIGYFFVRLKHRLKNNKYDRKSNNGSN